jgi:hypothetical protein
MRRTARLASGRWSRAAAALLVAAAATVRAEDAPPDEAARRGAIAKLGRLAWSDYGGPLAFCDLDGSNVVESDCLRADWLRWLPDRRRVVTMDGDHVRVVDSATGKSSDLTADARGGDRFVSGRPLLSPDGRHLVVWHTVQPDSTWHDRRSWSLAQQVVGFAVFDLDTGRRAEIAPAPIPRQVEDPPIAAWTADSASLYVALGTEPQRLTRFAADGTHPETVATVAPGSRITQIAIDGPRIVFAVQHAGGLEVRDPAGRTLFFRDGRFVCGALEWEPGGTALLVDATATGGPFRCERWRVVPGERAVEFPDLRAPRRQPSGDPAFEIETRRTGNFSPPRVYLAPVPPAEPIALESSGPVVRVGGAFVFWRTTTPFRETRRGTTWTSTPAVEDLWCYDPAARAFVRLTTRGFSPRCWDVALTAPASRTR